MFVLVTYDVNTMDAAGRRRLRQVAKQCVRHGQRVQSSVFECLLEPAQYATFQRTLCEIIDPEKDSLRFYHLGSRYQTKLEHFGVENACDPEGVLLL